MYCEMRSRIETPFEFVSVCSLTGPVADLIKRLWSRQPEDRPDCAQLLEIIKKLEQVRTGNSLFCVKRRVCLL
jgi:hypothetical protein